MTTVNLCKNCNYYTLLIKEMENHCNIENHDYIVIHTNTSIGSKCV